MINCFTLRGAWRWVCLSIGNRGKKENEGIEEIKGRLEVDASSLPQWKIAQISLRKPPNEYYYTIASADLQ